MEKEEKGSENLLLRSAKRVYRWGRRMIFGGSKVLMGEKTEEFLRLESPSRLTLKAFFKRKLAVLSLFVLIGLFMLVFIGSLFRPIDLAYTDPLQKNIPPVISMRRVPRDLSKNIRDISGFSEFTLGVGGDGSLYIWGASENALTGVDMAAFPDAVREEGVVYAAAGRDHAIAITKSGRVIGWGDRTLAQYGENTDKANPSLVSMPDTLVNGTVDLSRVDSLTCGSQVTALVIDGKIHAWGNANSCINLKELVAADYSGVEKVVFSNYYAVVLFKDGSYASPAGPLFGASASVSDQDKKVDLVDYLLNKRVIDIAASDNCFAFLCDDGTVALQSASRYGEDSLPEIPEGERIVSIASGTRHFAALTDAGKAYAWGHNGFGQCELDGISADAVYCGAYQTYLLKEGELVASVGMRGYLFGTDGLGRDILTRIIHGGKMTMTVGAVAVIVSSLIAIAVGCISGYFGGWVDLFLMRLTEIFSAIPFLPFAMLLSIVIRNYPISENMRIFIIMIILGVLSWTSLARIIRGQVLAEREKEFVTAARSMGVKESRIAFRHILPNIISVILVSVALDFAGCLLTESSLSYLGFGVQQPRPTWGNMLNGANNSVVIQNYWWQWVFPALFLAIATISINVIGDTLRDVLDPKSSQER